MKWLKLSKRKFKEKFYQKKVFTLIETIIVITIIGVLVLLGTPKFKGYVEEAKLTQIKGDVRTVESVMLADITEKTINSTDLNENLTGNFLTEDKNALVFKDSETLSGNKINNNNKDYEQIKEDFIKSNTTIKKNLDKFYFNKAKNEVGFLYEGKLGNVNESDDNNSDNNEEDIDKDKDKDTDKPEEDNKPTEPEKSYMATDADFEFIEMTKSDPNFNLDLVYKVDGKTGYFKYIGKEKIVEIPHEIQGHKMTSYYRMFWETDVEKIISTNKNITNMTSMFSFSKAKKLDVSEVDTSNVTSMWSMFSETNANEIIFSRSFDTSNVTNMAHMFYKSSAKELDLYSFDTSKVKYMNGMFKWSSAETITFSDKFNTENVEDMRHMFQLSSAKVLDLSSFDTSNVRYMGGMFASSSVTVLDLSSFDTLRVSDIRGMFFNVKASVGYAKTDKDADRFNDPRTSLPDGVTFQVKS